MDDPGSNSGREKPPQYKLCSSPRTRLWKQRIQFFNKLKRRSTAARCPGRKRQLITDKQTIFCGHATAIFCLEIHGNCVFDALGKAEPLRSTATHQMRAQTDKLTDGRTDGQTDWQTDTTMCFISLVQAGEHRQTNGQTDRRTDGRYQVHYLPRFAVDNKTTVVLNIYRTVSAKSSKSRISNWYFIVSTDIMLFLFVNWLAS